MISNKEVTIKYFFFQLIFVVQLLLTALAIWQTEAKSTRVSAQYSVSDQLGIDESIRHFNQRGSVVDDDAADDAILAKIANKRKVSDFYFA